MPRFQWLRPPRHMLVLFTVVAIVPATALTWLSWRLLEQDRALENQRIQERLERAADRVGLALERRLSETLDRLPHIEPHNDALAITLGRDSIEAHPPGRLLYYPFSPRTREAQEHVFATGEALEFRERDYASAIAIFRELARSEDRFVRAGALVRLGRSLRKNNQHVEALAVYDELSKLGSTQLGGDPVDLLARQERCVVLQNLNRPAQLHDAAGSLYADLQHSRWPLDRVSYQFHSREARRWLAEPATSSEDQAALALAAAVESLWEQWQEIQRGGEVGRGCRTFWAHRRSILLLWNGSPEKLVALAAGPGYLQTQWASVWENVGTKLTLVDSDSHTVIGNTATAGRSQAIRTAADTRLPWTLRVTSADPDAELAQAAGRRQLLLVGMALMGVLVLTGGYFTARAVTRELAVARLQSDFVSAVSHEFRTPLTSMRHLTESLNRGIVTEEGRRRQYYSALAHETTRLQRLVESLLNFGRMEAGAIEYSFERVSLYELVEEVVAEFQGEVRAGGHQIEIHADCGLASVCADREAMGRAVWNLLDNAVKYSPGHPKIWVELKREGKFIAIHVRDEGPGIPAYERREIFKKFVRGSAARVSNVKGTGIGLATVQHIIRAHRGRICVESQPGRGSTITLLLPVDD